MTNSHYQQIDINEKPPLITGPSKLNGQKITTSWNPSAGSQSQKLELEKRQAEFEARQQVQQAAEDPMVQRIKNLETRVAVLEDFIVKGSKNV